MDMRWQPLVTSVLPPGSGVCAICRGPAPPGRRRCFCCATVASSLASPLAPVIPISTYRIPGHLHTVLRGYKDAPVAEARRSFAAILGSLLDGFVDRHRQCLRGLAGRPLHLTVAVPPSERPGDAPIHDLGGLPWARGVLVRGPGPLGHLRPSTAGYVVAQASRGELAGRGVLLVEDTVTTGARVQSAAAALRATGAGSVVVLAIGRVVRPELGGHHAAYWRRASATPFSLGRCGLAGCPGERAARPQTLSGPIRSSEPNPSAPR
jgi:predicted amidophosphoribosyltransferase